MLFPYLHASTGNLKWLILMLKMSDTCGYMHHALQQEKYLILMKTCTLCFKCMILKIVKSFIHCLLPVWHTPTESIYFHKKSKLSFWYGIIIADNITCANYLIVLAGLVIHALCSISKLFFFFSLFSYLITIGFLYLILLFKMCLFKLMLSTIIILQH